MNSQQRKKIEAIVGTLQDLKSQVEDFQNEEYDKFSNMPESLQQRDKGQAMEQAANDLQEAADNFDQVIDKLEEAIQQ